MNNTHNGNVLFLILIAVGLFAALTFAISSTTRTNENKNRNETGELTATRILNFTASLQAGINRLSTINGVQPSELHYNNNVTTAYSGNFPMMAMGEPADPSLYVFHPKGGGVIPQKFENAITPCIGCGSAQVQSGHFGVYWIPMIGIHTDTSDLVLQVHDLNDDACLAINKRVGIDFTPNIIFNGGVWVATSIEPPTGKTLSTGVTNDDLDAIDGKLMYCIKKTNSPVRNMFLSVLKAY